jgi:hypothetical protein
MSVEVFGNQSSWHPAQGWRPLDHSDIRLMDAETLAAYRLAEEENVFGKGFKRGPDGRPLEQGRGAPGNETAQHLEALKREMERNSTAKSILDAARKR